MSLSASLSKYKSELAETAARNTKPSSTAPVRTSTPKPAVTASTNAPEKRKHAQAFTPADLVTADKDQGKDWIALSIAHLRDKRKDGPMPFDDLISWLSIPMDIKQSIITKLRGSLRGADRVRMIPKTESTNGKLSVMYEPFYPVTNADELLTFIMSADPPKALDAKLVKDGWPNCLPELERLDREGQIILIKNKKDGSARLIYPDSPAFHIGSGQGEGRKGKVDDDFLDFWRKTKLPANENDLRLELERAGLTPTSAVKEAKRLDTKKKERKRAMRRGGKTTNTHMMGILKEYPGKRG